MIDDAALPPPYPSRAQQIQRAKDLARQMLAAGEADALDHLFNFADSEWPFDHGLKIVFFEEIHAVLTEQRQARAH